MLLCDVLKVQRLALYTDFDRPLQDEELTRYRNAIIRRRNGEPTAYITGKKEFWSLSFEVTRDVLIPRPDTETLVESALARLDGSQRMLDLCTGTGCVAVAVASERPASMIDAIDISKAACRIAARNIANHDLSERIAVLEGDLFAPIPNDAVYDVITANPPYIPAGEMAQLQAEVQEEPKLALDGGGDGLDIVRRIIADAPKYLKDDGWLLIEVDPRQTRGIVSNASTSIWKETLILPDLAGRERVVALKINRTIQSGSQVSE